MFKPIKPTRASEEIINQIKNLISEGILRPGDQLPPERDLIKDFGVSRPTLREALKSLGAMGFLEVTSTKGTFVKSVISKSMRDPLSHLIRSDAQKIFDLIEVRKALETWSAFHAAKRATEDDIGQLESDIKKMKDASEKGQPWEKEDADFHLAIAQATHNTIQTHIMSTIYDLLRESVTKVFRDRAKVKKLLQQHYRIFSAIKNHSPERARDRILEHLDYVESEVKAFSNRNPNFSKVDEHVRKECPS